MWGSSKERVLEKGRTLEKKVGEEGEGGVFWTEHRDLWPAAGNQGKALVSRKTCP